MNSDQIGGILRAFLPAIVGFLGGGHYFFDAPTWNVILTSLATAGVAVWSYQTNVPGTVIPK